MVENNAKTKFTEGLFSFHFLGYCKKVLLQNYAKNLLWQMFTLCLIKSLNHWICFLLLPNLIWEDAISLFLLLRVSQGKWLLFEKLKGNYSLKRKKQSVRITRRDRCMLIEAATTRSSRSQMLLKIGVLKNFAIFTGKHRWLSLF